MEPVAPENDKIELAVLFGGRSGEHEISVISARSMMAAVDGEKFEVLPIYISAEGSWYFWAGFLQGVARPGPEAVAYTPVADPGRRPFLVRLDGSGELTADVIFPLLHGPYGEDGTIQGLLELAALPYVGSGPLAAALAMDKELSKNMLRANGISTVDYYAVSRRAFEEDGDHVTLEVEQRLRYPLFVKPANLGSSIGIRKVKDRASLKEALAEAARYDAKVLCEQAVNAREFECAVLGNEAPQASPVGEIVPAGDFYDYEAKYMRDDAELHAPADIEEALSRRVQDLALRAFLSHGCAGLARVDFFYLPDRDVLLVNELNTMPGFTPISMYPKLWQAAGLSYADLIGRLVDLAFESHAERTRSLLRYEDAVDVNG
ncbi:MAG: D-alanine--D-alanine ligase [Candidatus Coatesbacteria bacterium]|nr:MAG: D-alanine--D-alanine ligase [Candidatus Coatesbacteria bacterium]